MITAGVSPDVNAFPAHALSFIEIVGVLEQEGQAVEAGCSEGVIRPEGPLPDQQAAPRQHLRLSKTVPAP